MGYVCLDYIVCAILNPFFLSFMWASTLKCRWKKLSPAFLAFMFTLVQQIPCIVRTYSKNQIVIVSMGILQTGIIILYILICFTDRVWRKGAAFFIFLYMMKIGEFFGMLFISVINIRESLIAGNKGIILYKCGVVFIQIMLYMLTAHLWKNRFDYKESAKAKVILCGLPFLQLLVYIITHKKSQGNMYAFFPGPLGNITPFIGVVVDISVFFAIISQNEKDILTQKVSELSRMREIEKVRYRSMKIQQEKLIKIRHDFNNQLTVALHLTEEGKNETARELLEQIRKNIEETAEYDWCDNSIICAVLAEKEVMCRENGIELNSNVEVAENIGIQPVHLCSIFSNLIDNAINGCMNCHQNKRKISVRAAVRGDYLHVKVENFAIDPAETPHREGHGYGHEILREIARMYNGEFLAEWGKGIYTACISLELEK